MALGGKGGGRLVRVRCGGFAYSKRLIQEMERVELNQFLRTAHGEGQFGNEGKLNNKILERFSFSFLRERGRWYILRYIVDGERMR